MQGIAWGYRQRETGSALIYILVAIALLAGLTATFMGSSSQNQSSQSAFKLQSELYAQIQTIRSAIQECVLTYPDGDKTMPAAPATVGGVAVVRPYPLRPNNTYLASPTPGSSQVRNISCPGNPGNTNNHARIFTSSSGKFFPEPPSFFDNWLYYNENDGVFIMIRVKTGVSDAHVSTALQKLDASFSPCEAHFIEAISNTTIASNTTDYDCYAGRKCFVLHLVTTPSTLYPGEAPGTCP